MTTSVRRPAIWAGVLALAGAAALLVGCKARFDAEVAVGANGVPAPCCSGTYAAMDEIPAVGGELRLAEITPMPGEAPGTTSSAIAFPLVRTDVRAQVAQGMAVYTVTQTFENPFDRPIDAVYVFPLGDEAAVSGFTMTIGERAIVGEIARRDQARRTYEEARSTGYTTAIIEQEKANIFAQRIANIAPRETVRVTLEYTELLGHTDGGHELVFPLVVGPRYLPAQAIGHRPVGAHRAGARGRPGVTSVPYLADERDASTVRFTAEIDVGFPIQSITSPSHDIVATDVSPTRTSVALRGADEIPNRDLILRYQVAGPQTMVGLLAHRDGGDGSFVLTVQPKADYRTGDIAPRDVILVVDHSGSMDGHPLEQAVAVAGGILGTLTPRDTFNVLAFSSGVTLLAPSSLPGDPASVERGRAFLASLGAGGGTELQNSLVQALTTDPGLDRVRIVYLLSDGFVGNDDLILSAARGVLGHNRIIPVGIGSGPNRALLDRLAHVGRGFASYLTLSERAEALVPALVRRSAYPYLTNISIDWGGLDVTDVTPAVVPDVYAGLPLVVSGRYTRPGTGRITVRGTTAGRAVAIPLEVTLPAEQRSPPVASLWARRRIEAILLEDPGGLPAAKAEEVAAIGLQHHLVTQQTSFVAVDRSRIVAPGGGSQIVEQPAAMPEGVNIDTAIGPAESAAPSPDPGQVASSRGGWGREAGGGGGGGGGDIDPLTLLLAVGLVPLAIRLRRARAS